MFRGNIHRHLLTLSLANWAIAIICWTISAYLGIARPTNLIVYTVLFVVGLFAVIVAVGCYVLADFGTEPGRPAVAAAGATEASAAPAEAVVASTTAKAPAAKAKAPASKAKAPATEAKASADKAAGPGD